MNRRVAGEDLARQRSGRGRREIETPILNALPGVQMLSRVLVGENGCAFGMNPFVSIAVIKVPVRVDQVFDRPVIQTVQRFKDARLFGVFFRPLAYGPEI